jgi:hypothetical protein
MAIRIINNNYGGRVSISSRGLGGKFNYAADPLKIVSSGLVLNLDAGNTLSYPGTGTTWFDLSGNGNNATLTNGASYNSANGGTILFDGTNDYADTGNTIITSNNNFTMGVWAKSATGFFTNRIMGNGDSIGGTSGVDIIWNPESINKIYSVRRNGVSDATRDIYANAVNLNNQWHYIVLTYNTSTGSKMYYDTTIIGTNTVLGFTSSLPFRIGRDGNGTDAFNGNVSNVQIYNRELSSTEITQNYNVLKTRFGL